MCWRRLVVLPLLIGCFVTDCRAPSSFLLTPEDEATHSSRVISHHRQSILAWKRPYVLPKRKWPAAPTLPLEQYQLTRNERHPLYPRRRHDTKPKFRRRFVESMPWPLTMPHALYFGFDRMLPLKPSINPSFKPAFRISGIPSSVRVNTSSWYDEETDFDALRRQREDKSYKKYLFVDTKHYGHPAEPDILLQKVLEKDASRVAEGKKSWLPDGDPSSFIEDTIHVHSNGTIMKIYEKTSPRPYRELGSSNLRREINLLKNSTLAEPRFVVRAHGGYAAATNLSVGLAWDMFNSTQKEEVWDNVRVRPQKYRWPEKNKDGKVVY